VTREVMIKKEVERRGKKKTVEQRGQGRIKGVEV
jgi:hypothetical protein